MAKTVRKEKQSAPVVVNQVVVRPVDRSHKDIATYRNAHIAAESVAYANRTRLYDLYDDILLDGHLSGVIQKRIDAVLNKSLHFERNGNREDKFDYLIESEEFRGLVTEILHSKLWGITGFEFIPGPELRYELIPRKHIKPQLGIIAWEQNGQDGLPYDGVQNLWIVGGRNDLGLLLKCAPYALYKRGSMADWAQFIEIFGQPVRVVKYDAYDKQSKIELQTILDESGSALAIMIPKQADFEMMDGKSSNADGSLQNTFKNALDNEMSIIILGNTETTSNSNGGSLAKSKEHSKQQLEITKSDMKFVANWLNKPQFLSILAGYGYPVENGRFVFEKEVDLEELKSRKDIDLAISQKVPIGDDYWYETYGIPKPKDYTQLKAKMEAPPAAPGAKPAPPKGKPKPKPLASAEELSFWEKLRAHVADFFDPAPKP